MVEVVLGLIEELDVRFPKQSVLDAIGVVYPQHWLQANVDNIFPQHLRGFESLLLHPMSMWSCSRWQISSNGAYYFLAWDLDVQQGFFKLTMKSSAAQAMAKVVALASDKAHPMVVNPPTHLWLVIKPSQLLSHTFPKYLELAEIVMTDIFGFVEDEWCFSLVYFLKDKVHNHLNPHCN